MTGGLFLEEEVAVIQDGTKFIPDHDQRHGLFAAGSYSDDRRGWRASATFRYQTGTPLGIDDDVEEPHRIEGGAHALPSSEAEGES